jgi:hypothetical protein
MLVQVAGVDHARGIVAVGHYSLALDPNAR